MRGHWSADGNIQRFWGIKISEKSGIPGEFQTIWDSENPILILK